MNVKEMARSIVVEFVREADRHPNMVFAIECALLEARKEALEEAATFLENHNAVYSNVEPYHRVEKSTDKDVTRKLLASAIRALSGKK